jgi:hypothetical protein
MKKLIVGLCLLACVPAAQAATTNQQPDAWILEDIEAYRNRTWHYQETMGVARTRFLNSAATDPATSYKLWVRRLWLKRAASAKKRFAHGPDHRRQWLCIHRHEGPWRARTGNGYYGGLQMDIDFQRIFGRHLLRKKGTADGWTPLEQMWVAEKAFRSGRGFHPWPNTARACGLI